MKDIVVIKKDETKACCCIFYTLEGKHYVNGIRVTREEGNEQYKKQIASGEWKPFALQGASESQIRRLIEMLNSNPPRSKKKRQGLNHTIEYLNDMLA